MVEGVITQWDDKSCLPLTRARAVSRSRFPIYKTMHLRRRRYSELSDERSQQVSTVSDRANAKGSLCEPRSAPPSWYGAAPSTWGQFAAIPFTIRANQNTREDLSQTMMLYKPYIFFLLICLPLSLCAQQHERTAHTAVSAASVLLLALRLCSASSLLTFVQRWDQERPYSLYSSSKENIIRYHHGA